MSRSMSGVSIEVLSEAEFAEEKQRELEEQAERRARLKQQQQQQNTGPSSDSPSSSRASPKESSSASTTSSSASSPSPFAASITELLSALELPAFFCQLPHTRLYESDRFQSLQARDIPQFHRTALTAFLKLAATLSASASSSITSASSTAAVDPSSSIAAALDSKSVLSVVIACIRFLIPSLPPTPSLPAGSSSFPAIDDSEDAALSSPQVNEEFLWINPAVALQAAKTLQILAIARQQKSKVGGDGKSIPIQPIPSSHPNAIESILSSPHVLDLLCDHVHSIVGVARDAMRRETTNHSGIGASGFEEVSPAWKDADRFPKAFYTLFILRHIPNSRLQTAGEIEKTQLLLSNLLTCLLPLVADHESRYKIAGLIGLQLLLQNTPSSYFPSSRFQVVEQAVKPCLNFKHRAIIALAVPVYIQNYMANFPAILQVSQEQIKAIAVAEGIRERETSLAAAASVNADKKLHSPSDSKTKSAAFPTISRAASDPIDDGALDLLARSRAHSELLQTVLQETIYYTLSPTAENAFALFVYAQSLLPLLLYVGPLGIMPNLSQLLSLLFQWSSSIFLNAQPMVVQRSYECLELLLHMQVVDQRITDVGHAEQIIENIASNWIETLQADATGTSLSSKSSLTTPTQATMIQILKLLRAKMPPNAFDRIWNEVTALPQLKQLSIALLGQMKE